MICQCCRWHSPENCLPIFSAREILSTKQMTTARHMLALLKSHIEGDEEQFFSVAMQLAAHEARQGHVKLAQELRDLIEKARERAGMPKGQRTAPVLLMQPKTELANLLSVRYPETRLSSLVLPQSLETRLKRVLLEQKQQKLIREHGLSPRRKLLLVGPPGSGKTLTAAAIAGELRLPLFTILLEGVITKYMGETAAKLKLVFDAMRHTHGVYFFDEVDALGARRNALNDVGEIRRVLNSFLQFIESDDSAGLIVAATNHPELLDIALFRRFDDVIQYELPSEETIQQILKRRLASFDVRSVEWSQVVTSGQGLSQAELSRAGDEAAKQAVLSNSRVITTELLLEAMKERHTVSQKST